MEILREKILVNIETALKMISVANGYENTLGSVQRWKQAGNTLAESSTVIVESGAEDKNNTLYDLAECLFNISINLFIRHNQTLNPGSTDTLLNSLLGDIEKAIMQDTTRGGHAIDTLVTGNTPFETVEGQAYAGLIIELDVKYRHKKTDLTQGR